ncbi:MAG: tetratricopeptide repeat protein [Nitrospinota bacterium]
MLARFLLTLLPLLLGGLFLLGGLYLLVRNPGDIRLIIFPGREVHLVVAVLASALLGALGASLSDLPSRAMKGWRRRRERRTNLRLQEAEDLYQSGLAALSTEDLPLARRAFQRALRKNPNHPNALLAFGDLQRRLGNLASAFDFHRKALQAGSDDLRLLESLAEDFASTGRPDALRALWERARQAGQGESVPLARLRDYHVSQGEWEAAVNVQESLLRLPGETWDGDARKLFANLLYEAGSSCLDSGRSEEGRELLQRAIRNDGDCVPARVALGDAYRNAGQNRKALRVWREGYERIFVYVFLHRVMSLLKTEGAGEEVIQTLRKTLRKCPSDDRVRLCLAEAHLEEGRPEEALAELKNLSAPERYPQQTQLLRARALLDVKDFSAAHSELSTGPVENRKFWCSACGETIDEWSGRCPSCGQWGSLDAKD